MMHNKHVCPEYAGDCKDQFPVFSPVGINKKDLAGMIPVFSTIGRGPRGEGVTVKRMENGSYQFISTISGEVVSEVPVLEAGSFEVINNTPNPVGGEPVSVTIRQTLGGEVKDCNLSIPSGVNGASLHTCSVLLEKNESNRYSLLLSSFTEAPSVRDSVLFKTIDGEDEFLTLGEVYSVIAGTVGVNALSYLGAGWDSPNIGENGNWWVGNSDTGIPAMGPKGDGLPEGGKVGQVMTKTESGPMWADASAPEGQGIRAGFIYVNPSDVLPDGFLWCDGAEHSRTEYPELFAAIGTLYGEGDGSTTFNVPDLQTRVPVGAGDGYIIGDMGGEAEHTLTEPEMPSHDHVTSVTNKLHEAGNTDGYLVTGSYSVTATTGTRNAGNDQPHNNMQPYTVVNYIISTGKGTGVSVEDIIRGATALPLGVEYGGTGATSAANALANFGVADYIVAEGTSGNWEWRKWVSGKAECWGVTTQSVTGSYRWGGAARWGEINEVSFPFAFTDVPNVSLTAQANGFLLDATVNWPTVTGFDSLVWTVDDEDWTTTVNLCTYAIGRWK